MVNKLGSFFSFATAALAAFGAPPDAHAAKAQRLVACVVDAPGSTKVAQPYFDKFFRAAEAALGWPANTLRGRYTPSDKRCKKELKKKTTTLAILSLDLYAALAAKMKLKPLAVATIGGSPTTKYHVIVKKGAVASLAELKGATLLTNHGGDAKFLARVVLGGALGRKVPVSRTREPLRALRAVNRGQAKATVVDDAELEKMKQLPFADDLATVFTSEALPNPVVVALGARAGDAAAAFAEKLPSLCQGETKATCDSMLISGFAPADAAALAAAVAKYK